MVFETWLVSDLKKPMEVVRLTGNLFSADNQGNLIGVRILDDGEAATISGAVRGYVIREDGKTVVVPGTLSGNEASIILPRGCYNVPGPVSIVIKVDKTTVGACTGYVYQTTTESLVDPAGEVPSIADLMDAVATATAAAGQVENAVQAATSALSYASQASANTSHMNAVFAQNIAEIEEDVDDAIAEMDSRMDGQDETISDFIENYEEYEQNVYDLADTANGTADEANAKSDQAVDIATRLSAAITMAGIPLQVINRPNLLKQDYGYQVNLPSSAVLTKTITIPVEDATAAASALTFTITDENITANHVIHWGKCSSYDVMSWRNITGVFSAGSVVITVPARSGAHEAAITVTLYLCTVTTGMLPYGEEAHVYGSSLPWMNSTSNPEYPGGDVIDGISERIIDLAAADQIEDDDGELYTTAIQYSIIANSAWGNADWLVFNYGQVYERKYPEGTTEPKAYGDILAMEPGHVYTLSCWARITSGEKAWVSFGYGGKYGNTPYKGEYSNSMGIRSEPVEVTGGTWQRIHWRFVFNPDGDWFTYTTAEEEGVNVVTRVENWTKRVLFGVHRKYTATLELCGFRLTAGSLWQQTEYDELYDRVLQLTGNLQTVIAGLADLTDRVDDLEAEAVETPAGS